MAWLISSSEEAASIDGASPLSDPLLLARPVLMQIHLPIPAVGHPCTRKVRQLVEFAPPQSCPPSEAFVLSPHRHLYSVHKITSAMRAWVCGCVGARVCVHVCVCVCACASVNPSMIRRANCSCSARLFEALCAEGCSASAESAPTMPTQALSPSCFKASC